MRRSSVQSYLLIDFESSRFQLPLSNGLQTGRIWKELHNWYVKNINHVFSPDLSFLDDTPFVISVQKNAITGWTMPANVSGIGSASQVPQDPVITGMVPVAGLTNARDVDYDEMTATMYYLQLPVKGQLLAATVTKNAFVYKTQMTGGNATQFLASAKPGDANCLAFDWLARNLYIGNKDSANIEVVRTVGQAFRTAVVSSDGSLNGVTQPVAIALFPTKGLLFWLDEGGKGTMRRLSKANMDGTNPRALIATNLAQVDGLTIDLVRQRLFFSQADRGVIESCDFDGNARRVEFDAAGLWQPRGLSIFEDKLYFADDAHDAIVVGTYKQSTRPASNYQFEEMKKELNDVNNVKVFYRRPSKNFEFLPFDILKFCIFSAVADHPCRKNNGDCEHICVPSPQGYRNCLCASGSKLDDSGLHCAGHRSFMLYTTDREIRGAPISTTGSVDQGEAITPVGGTKITSVDVEVRTRSIYYAEATGERRGVNRISADGGEPQRLVDGSTGSYSIQNIAVDWVNYNLYMIAVDSDRTAVDVVRLDGQYRMTLFATQVESPRSIAVDPINR